MADREMIRRRVAIAASVLSAALVFALPANVRAQNAGPATQPQRGARAGGNPNRTVLPAANQPPAPEAAKTVGQIGKTKPIPPYIVGADISWVQQREASGTKYSDDGVEKDILQILKAHGFNYIRLRIFNDPTKGTPRDQPYSPQGFCDLDHTIDFAKRVKAAGMGLLIDFHYSDSWADPGKQFTPAVWKDLPFPQLVAALHDWTKASLQKMKDAGCEPDMVQIGNEITPGMMTDGANGGGSTRNWDQLAQLLQAGSSACTEVNPKMIVALHIDRGGNNPASISWYDNAISRGVQFDLIAESCYTNYQGSPDGWKANFENMAARYPNLYFTSAEIGADAVRQANDIQRALPNGRGLGTFIWEPTNGGLFTGGRRGGGPATAPAAAPARAGAVIPDRMAAYDQLVKDYGLKTSN